MSSSKPRKGEVRKRNVVVPDHPWPVGSLCANTVNLMIVSATAPYYEHERSCARFPLNAIRPDYFVKVEERSLRELVSVPHLYLGLTTRILDKGKEDNNVELIFLSSWGYVTWTPEFYYDGQLRSMSLFMKQVGNAFKCVSRFDKALG